MTELFEGEEEDIIEEESFVNDGDDIDIDVEALAAVDGTLDARRRLENMLEEKRLREELDDFLDY
ncbi:hypothetical protein DIZ81_06230 [Legionella taurinensis]|uniref:Uncharacterized protein n=1 Tax=Legionella taurinensis TaxID=70611 RepID=A0A3A5L925_9GAMM|nr:MULTISPECIES: hypothetical protein [Legionella]MDX1837516.1 hypothetical protein [Legionella taurinensis]PUT40855.1 hypothetical protein DB744_06230 [Legionella taurinensis]PUT44276.1 hypothetical protein DB746_04630 [Legionella taurinensis]PUT47578.1 hypothetical protein DB743_02800 [Legionella taurinensis]PUT48717.1 hypothetical protein DB745_04630 [Legionella taurinensis]